MSSMPDEPPADSAPAAEPIALAELLRQKKPEPAIVNALQAEPATSPVKEIGGRRDGPEPTRYGDWEKNGRCIDF